MSYRRRQELIIERRQRRSMDERADRDMYYSHRLRTTEEILSRLFSRYVSLTVRGGWVRFNGKNYRIDQIEQYALRLDALAKEREDEAL